MNKFATAAKSMIARLMCAILLFSLLPVLPASATGISGSYWEFTAATGGWTAPNHVSGFGWQSGGYVGGTVTGVDPQIMSGTNLGVNIFSNKILKVRLKNTTSSTIGQVFFITDTDGTWNDAKHKDFPIVANSDFTEYTIDMSTVSGWAGTLKQLRIDPGHGASSGTFSIDYVRINAAGVGGAWEFASTADDWTAANQVSGFGWQSGGVIGGSITGSDPQLFSGTNLNMDINKNKFIKIRLKNSTTSTLGQIFFITNADGTWDTAKHKDFPIVANSDYTEYVINMSDVAGWAGTLKQLRLDPENGASSGSFSIEFIRIQETKFGMGKRVVAYFPFYHYDFPWEYSTNLEGWTAPNHVSGFGWQTGGYAGGTVTGNDPQLLSASNLGYYISNYPLIKVRLKNGTASTAGQIYFITDADGTWDNAKRKDFPIVANSDYTEYTIDMSTVAGWAGTLKQLRLDPGSGAPGGSFSIDYIRISDGLTYKADQIPFDKLTHINHAFVGVNMDGSLDVHPKFLNPDLIADAHAAGVKVILSVSYPIEALQTVAASSTLRQTFASNLESFIRSNGYDGFDLDWEYPSNATERTNYTLLMQAVRAKFDSSAAPAPSWSTSIALNGYVSWVQWFDLTALDPVLTYYNLMAYDMHGAWSGNSGHNSPLYQGTDPDTLNVQTYIDHLTLDRGVPIHKINLGVPFYGWQFPNSETLYDNCGGSCSAAKPVYYNKDIVPLIGNGWTRFWDSGSLVPYLRKDSGPGLITYDDSTSIYEKVNYALHTRGAGGVFIWELSQDFTGTSHPLLDAVHAGVT